MRRGAGDRFTYYGHVLIRRLAALAATVVLAWVSLLLGTASAAAAGAAIAILLAVLTYASQPAAVLVLAAFSPLGGVLAIATGSAGSWTMTTEFAVLAGWSMRHAVSPRPFHDVPFRLWTLAAAAVAVSSGIGLWAGRLWAELPHLDEAVDAVLSSGSLLSRPGDPMSDALTVAGGVMTALFVAETSRRDPGLVPRAIRMLMVSVVSLACLSLYRLSEVALRQGLGPSEVFSMAGTIRVSPILADVNAAGSLFLLMIPVAAEYYLEGRRVLGAASLFVLICGAWLAGSRVALAMIGPALLVLLILRTKQRARRWLMPTILAVVTALFVLIIPSSRHTGASTAWTVRRDATAPYWSRREWMLSALPSVEPRNAERSPDMFDGTSVKATSAL